MKTFCRLVQSLIADINRKLFFETHTKIPLRVHGLVFPILKVVAQGGFDYYPKNFANILDKLIGLHPLKELVPFNNISNILKVQTPEAFEKLVKNYFDHVGRINDISWMFELIESNS